MKLPSLRRPVEQTTDLVPPDVTAVLDARPTFKFKYTAIDPAGKETKGVLEGVSAVVVHRMLIDRGLQPVTVSRQVGLFGLDPRDAHVDRRAVANFSRQLAVFVQADVPLHEALEVIGVETQNPQMRNVIFELMDGVLAGRKLPDIAKAYKHTFPAFYIGVLEAAERTGELDKALYQLAAYLDRDNDAVRKMKSALIYPTIVVSMTILTIVISMVYVMPPLLGFFQSLHAKVPLATKILVWVSRTATESWPYILGALVAVVATIVIMRRTPAGTLQVDKWVLALPGVGEIVRAGTMERMFRILAASLKAGVDLPDAMEVSAASASNTVYRDAFLRVRVAASQGQALTDAMIRTGLFPSTVTQMFRTGEQTATLDCQVDVAAEYQKQELETKITRFLAALEPILTTFIGCLVLAVAIALISAMYGAFSQVHLQ